MKTTKFVRVAAIVMTLVLALSVASFAAVDFVDSIGFKPLPPFEVTETPDGVDVIVTPIAKADEVTDEKLDKNIKNLKDAYAQLKDAKTLTDIVKEADLKKVLGVKDGYKYDVNNLEVANLFDFWSSDGKGYETSFDLALGEKDLFAVLFKDLDGNWSVLSADSVKVAGGKATVTLPANGSVAFLVDVDGQSDIVPDTSDPAQIGIWVAVIAVAGIALAVVLVSLKKKKEN